MPLVLRDRVKETSTTTGTGTLTLAGAVSGFQSFAVIGNANTTYYTITDNTGWEVGVGTYTASGTTLSRDTILESSNAGAAVNWGAGTRDVFVTYPAERAVDTALVQTLSNKTFIAPALGTPASATLTNATGLPIVAGTTGTLSVARGGTGITSFGAGIATFLTTPSSGNLAATVTDETGSGALVFNTSPTLVTPALGTPSALVGTNITGTAAGLTAGNVTTNANLTGAVTSVGNTTSLGSFTSAQLATALTDETGSGANVFATLPTLSGITINDGYTEEVFAITDGTTVNLNPNNGSIQTWTLSANRTPGQASWAAGQSITLQVDDGAAFSITWTTLAVVWKTDGGVAPTLNTTGITAIVLWKVGATIYGARVGDA